MNVDETVDFRQDGTLIVNTRHYNNVERVLVENGTSGTLFYPDDDGRNNHKVEEAIRILKNTAWLGSNDDRDKTKEAVKVVEEALKSKPFDTEDERTTKMLEDTIYNSAYVSGYNDALKEIKEAIKELADFDTVDILVRVAWLIDDHKKAVKVAEGEITRDEC